jgi:hypothetical protein
MPDGVIMRGGDSVREGSSKFYVSNGFGSHIVRAFGGSDPESLVS